MAPIRPCLAAAVIAVSALAGCADGQSASENCGEALVAEPGELRTVLRASALGAAPLILGTAALPDGSIVVAYEGNPEEAGGEENWVSDPGLVLLRPDGSCEPFPRPVVDGVRVGLDAQPVAVDSDGRLYLWEGDGAECRWDGAECRLVRGTVDRTWEKVVVVPADRLMYAGWPDVAVSREGEVYIATDFLVSRVTASGELEPVAGTGKPITRETYPPPDLGDFPRPGTSAPLTHLRGIAAKPTGEVVIVTTSAVLELSPTGILHLVADPETTAGQDGAIEALHNDDTGAEAGSHLHTPAVVDSGDILVSDTGKKRILRIHDGRSAVFLTDPNYVSVSLGHALLADRAGLLVRVHEERGHNLAVFGFPAG